MAEFKYVIKDEVGLHARPAGELVKLAKSFDQAISIEKNGKVVDATRLLAVMGLGVKKGEEVTITCDDAGILEQVKRFFEHNL